MYRLDPDQTAVVERARDIAEREIAPHAARVDADGEFPREAIAALAEAGFLGLTIASEYGGMGHGPRVAAAVLDEIAQRCASTGMIYLMHLCGVACYSAMPEHAEPYLRASAAGDHLSTLAWSERGSRSQFWAPVSQAVADDGGVTVSADKSWVTSAGKADGYVGSTRSAGAEAPTDTMLYLVLRDDAGVSVAGGWEGLGMRGNASAPMRLERAAVGDERALSAPGQGLATMLSVVLPIFQIGNAAVCVGIAEAAVQATQRHLTGSGFANTGRRLADLPNLRARLAQMRIETDRARAHLAGVVDAVETPGPTTTLLVLEAKAAASETAIQVTDI
ncbi:MAG TPA: acyl-CoA dehydrogenase family protein, partial [Thermomicrobiales bacterium]|nr:acyl-CoA dehydrogenase family protein [Thermomicrobiales bacterium]